MRKQVSQTAKCRNENTQNKGYDHIDGQMSHIISIAFRRTFTMT